MRFELHTPTGIVTLDTETVTDGQLAELGLTMADIAPQIQEANDQAIAEALLATSPEIITAPEIWALLRIYGRKLGYYR